MTSRLFEPFAFRSLKLDNRIMVSPMCQYSAEEGSMTDWHVQHLGSLSMSGAGLLCFEMTDVEPVGRISLGCSGLWSDDNEAALGRVADTCRHHVQAKLAVQLAHAGRKGSQTPPWEGARPLRPDEGAWQTVAPSPVPMDDSIPAPRELSRPEIQAMVEKFVDAARRCERAGIDAIELHGAHGYLIHQFLSPLSNKRKDDYGGSLPNRMRFALEVFHGVRAAWPQDRPLGIRLSCTDGADGGWTMDETVALVRELKAMGCDWIDCSSGGSVRTRTAFTNPALHTDYAAHIRRETGVPTIAVGLITEPQQAEAILAEGKADMVALARGVLWDPRWGWHAAVALGAEPRMPRQYLRGRPA